MIDGELMPRPKTWDVTRKDLPAFVSACLTGAMAEYSLGDIIEVAETLTTAEEMETFFRSYDDMLKSQNKDYAHRNMAYLLGECLPDDFLYTWEQAYEDYFGASVEQVTEDMLNELIP